MEVPIETRNGAFAAAYERAVVGVGHDGDDGGEPGEADGLAKLLGGDERAAWRSRITPMARRPGHLRTWPCAVV